MQSYRMYVSLFLYAECISSDFNEFKSTLTLRLDMFIKLVNLLALYLHNKRLNAEKCLFYILL